MIIKHAERYFKSKPKKMVAYTEYVMYNKRNVPKYLVTDKGLLCPSCLVDNKKNILKENQIEKVKIYVKKRNDYINTARILSKYTLFNFREQLGFKNFEVLCYVDNMDSVYRSLDWTKTKDWTDGNNKKKITVTMDIKKGITMDHLRKDLKDYEDRRLIKEI